MTYPLVNGGMVGGWEKAFSKKEMHLQMVHFLASHACVPILKTSLVPVSSEKKHVGVYLWSCLVPSLDDSTSSFGALNVYFVS